MSHLVLTIGPAHTLRQAARMMSARRIGAAVVIDPEQAGVGILTERDILDSICFPAVESSAGRKGGLPSWSERSASRPWRSIF
jgi:CBS domain-containing protein